MNSIVYVVARLLHALAGFPAGCLKIFLVPNFGAALEVCACVRMPLRISHLFPRVCHTRTLFVSSRLMLLWELMCTDYGYVELHE